MMKTAVIYLYPKKLFQNSISFLLKFCVSSLLLLATALGLGKTLFPEDNSGFLNTSAEDEQITVVIDPGHTRNSNRQERRPFSRDAAASGSRVFPALRHRPHDTL